jgi:hypothetical protein
MPENLRCLRCGGTLQEGFIPNNYNPGIFAPARWVEGKPKTYWLTGWQARKGMKSSGIISYRRVKYDHLELLAGTNEAE